jgi:hypothetical protein
MTSRPAADRWSSWQAMDSGRLLLLATTAMLLVAAFATITIRIKLVDINTALAFGGFIALGELLRLALPGGREAAPIAMIGGMSYALLPVIPQFVRPHAQPAGPLIVIAVAAVGMMVGALPHIAAGRTAGLTGMCTRLLAIACVAFIFRSTGLHLFAEHVPVAVRWWVVLAVETPLVLIGWLVDCVISALIRADDVGAKFSVSITDEIRVQWTLGAAVVASVLITVNGYNTMGLYELAIFLGPLLVTQVAFRRYAGIRATYLQTVRSLARVTEVAGYVEAGHSRQVSRLAVAVGRELGMPEVELLQVEYAALMHDIGQLSLAIPIPGGATVLVSPADQERIAELGADVISQAGVLDVVAELVRCQSWPARGHDPQPPVGSMIIKAANTFDDMVGASTERERSANALDRMRQDPDSYDHRVVAALGEVAGRRPAWRL